MFRDRFGITTYSDSTFKRMNKSELIEYIRMIETNWRYAEESLEIQYNNCKKLLVEEYNQAVDDVLKEIKPCVICSSYPNDCEDRKHFEICVSENSKTYKNLRQTIERLKKGKE